MISTLYGKNKKQWRTGDKHRPDGYVCRGGVVSTGFVSAYNGRYPLIRADLPAVLTSNSKKCVKPLDNGE